MTIEYSLPYPLATTNIECLAPFLTLESIGKNIKEKSSYNISQCLQHFPCGFKTFDVCKVILRQILAVANMNKRLERIFCILHTNSKTLFSERE